jgi:hypothetical protein
MYTQPSGWSRIRDAGALEMCAVIGEKKSDARA